MVPSRVCWRSIAQPAPLRDTTVLVNDPFETREVRRAVGRRPIDLVVVEEVARLFIPVSAILDLLADRVGHDLPEETDAIGAHSQALAEWFRQPA